MSDLDIVLQSLSITLAYLEETIQALKLRGDIKKLEQIELALSGLDYLIEVDFQPES